MAKDFYDTPASQLGMTAKELLLSRLNKLAEIKMNGGQIKETALLSAGVAAVS